MTAATFTVPFAGQPGSNSGRVQVVLAPVSAALAPVTLTITDRNTTHAGQAPVTAKLGRPGRKPLFFWVSPDLQTVQLSCTLDGRGSPVEATIARLQALVKTQVTVANFGEMLGGRWWVSECEIDPTMRQAGTNAVTRATVKITLTEASDAPGATVTVVTNP